MLNAFGLNLLYLEIIILLYPSFSASAILLSILFTALISPERPISPAKHVKVFKAIS